MLKTFVTLGALNAGLSVMLGAFGAHGLKILLSPEMLAVYHTGVEYHAWHALGLILIGLISAQLPDNALLAWAGGFMLGGMLLFSGSLYVLSITGIRWLGAITPFGGASFIIAWALVVIAVLSASG